jgi:Uma2 family endonuclease
MNEAPFIVADSGLDGDSRWTIREVAPGYDSSWVPVWARGGPVLKIGDKDPPYTYEDWLEWPLMETTKLELLDGLLIALATPTSFHAGIEADIMALLWNFLRGKKGKVYGSELGVRLFPQEADKKDQVAIEPDISVILDTSRITKQGYDGAPDFVIEILSPSSRREDRIGKFNRYQEAGVKEYWIIDPDDRTVQVNLLESGKYVVSMYGEEKVPVATLPGCEIDFAEVFQQPGM